MASQASRLTGTEPHHTPETSLHTIREDGEQLDGHLNGIELEIEGYEYMMLRDQRYLCSIPRVIPEDDRQKSNTTAEDEAKELELAAARGWDLLKDMEGNCIYYSSGWWSYSFCHNEGVRQFHQLPPGRNVPHWPPIEDQGVAAYVLGKFGSDRDENANPSSEQQKTLDSGDEAGKEIRERGLVQMETKGEMTYLVQKLGGGTTCDLTGKPRKVEVQVSIFSFQVHRSFNIHDFQFYCDPTSGDRINVIKEISTCQYLMVISTPRLCSDVAFQPPQDSRPHLITCSPVVSEEQLPAWLAAKDAREEEQDRELDEKLERVLQGLQTGQIMFDRDANGDIRDAKPLQPQTVGGIVVGGNNIVPKGIKIEKSAIVGGGKETLVATIARSDGFILSDKELRGLKIPGGKEVEAVKKEISKVAQGKAWRLDIVETPRGRELRGIIDEGEDEESPPGEDGSSEGGGETMEKIEDGEAGSEEGYKEEL